MSDQEPKLLDQLPHATRLLVAVAYYLDLSTARDRLVVACAVERVKIQSMCCHKLLGALSFNLQPSAFSLPLVILLAALVQEMCAPYAVPDRCLPTVRRGAPARPLAQTRPAATSFAASSRTNGD